MTGSLGASRSECYFAPDDTLSNSRPTPAHVMAAGASRTRAELWVVSAPRSGTPGFVGVLVSITRTRASDVPCLWLIKPHVAQREQPNDARKDEQTFTEIIYNLGASTLCSIPANAE